MWLSLWNLLIDVSQLLGGVGVFFAAIEFRRWSRSQKRASLDLRTFAVDKEGTASSRLTNVGAASANILSLWQRDAIIDSPMASCIPSRLAPGESVELTFRGCNSASRIWVGYNSSDESDRIRFACLPLMEQPNVTQPHSQTSSPTISDMIGVHSSRWHHGDHLSPTGKSVTWIRGLGRRKKTLRKMVEIIMDIHSQGGKSVPLRMSATML